MLHKNPTLRVKLKTLAYEARVIRREERLAHDRMDLALVESLHNHRTHIVRREARATLLAYQYLRGFKYEAVEADAKTRPWWDAVHRMVHKHGGLNFGHKKWIAGKNLEEKMPAVAPAAPAQAA